MEIWDIDYNNIAMILIYGYMYNLIPSIQWQYSPSTALASTHVEVS